MNRRGFLSLLAKGAVGVALAPIAVQAFEPVNLSVPITWTALTGPVPVDKVAWINGMLDRAIEAHDKMIEEAIFQSTLSGVSHDIRGLQSRFEGPYHPTEEIGPGSFGNTARFWRSDVGGARREG